MAEVGVEVRPEGGEPDGSGICPGVTGSVNPGPDGAPTDLGSDEGHLDVHDSPSSPVEVAHGTPIGPS